MPAGRAAGDDDEVGIAPVLGDVLLHPGDRPLDVDDLVGPGAARGEAVVERDAHPAALGEVPHERGALLLLAARHPRPAVHLDEHRRAGVVGEVGPAPDVEVVPPPELAVGDVAGRGVAAAQRGQGVGDLSARDRDVLGRREGGGHPAPVVRAEPLDERGLEHLVGPGRDPVQTDESGPRGRRERQPGSTSARPEAPGGDEAGGGQGLPGERVQGHLGHGQAAGERQDRGPPGAAHRAPGVEGSGRADRTGRQEGLTHPPVTFVGSSQRSGTHLVGRSSQFMGFRMPSPGDADNAIGIGNGPSRRRPSSRRSQSGPDGT